MKPENYFKGLTDDHLISFVEDLKLPSYPVDSLVRQAVTEIFGKEEILRLQAIQLLWPALTEITERFKKRKK